MRFADRRDAGRRLGAALDELDRGAVVLGIPRGGVVVASEVAQRLGAPLDIVVARKLGHPQHPEAGFGAVAEQRVVAPPEVAELLAGEHEGGPLHDIVEAERVEVERQVERFVGDRPRPDLTDKTAIVVDDGIATGYTVVAALEAARARGAGRLIAAAPVASREGAALVERHCDRLVVAHVQRRGPFAVSMHYQQFGQVDDETVAAVLE